MDEHVHKGHRSRMRRKFDDFGAIVFDTYELLEMLLYTTVPVKDTNGFAKKLLNRFGSLDGVLSASKEELMLSEGIGEKTAEFLVAAGETLDFFTRSGDKTKENAEFENYYFVGEYLTKCLSGEDYRQVLMSFDNDMRLLGIDEMYECDYSSAAVKTDKFIDSALKRGATVAIIAHNHPYGPICPTDGDRATNDLIGRALSKVGVFLAEHYVVCGDRYFGFMNHFNEMFAQKPRVAEFIRSKGERGNEYSK